MKSLLELLSQEMGKAFEAAGYDASLGRVSVSNRPDLCEYQCNGAMSGAKQYHKAPIAIATVVLEKVKESGEAVFASAEAVNPGFLNLKVSPAYLAAYLKEMEGADRFGMNAPAKPSKVIIDFGGANVAKPLHVGHMRSAVIGEAIKRMLRYAGNTVIGDAHLGDWGLQIGLAIEGLRDRKPDLPYFDPDFTGEYPAEAPFTIEEFAVIYPESSARSKEDPDFKARAMDATKRLQKGERGYRALWKQIMAVSVPDLKKNYDALNVEFDLWKGESDADDRIPSMVQYMKDAGYAHISEGALVVDVKEETDTKEIPPCMILKSDGASLYNTTDLATIQNRMEEDHPDQIIYVVDKRQSLYFEQVFRCAYKTKLVPPETKLTFLGFGTMNGPDGKPFKTREGGVMPLQRLIADTKEEMYHKILEGRPVSEEEAREIADLVAVAALKYGDLSNQASKDYVFDIDRFTSFEGDTGPYILYTIVRIKSILAKYEQQGGAPDRSKIGPAQGESEKNLQMMLSGFASMMEGAVAELAPHKVCGYVYDLANAFNKFYHETQILTEGEERKAELIALLMLTRDVLETA
ncbi:MAG: arginine--tRNA ligase, partial [Lachnospiraceae bacterium]|nr:arginine--tRNA ligase [Lachnospiraceae bacterium]